MKLRRVWNRTWSTFRLAAASIACSLAYAQAATQTLTFTSPRLHPTAAYAGIPGVTKATIIVKTNTPIPAGACPYPIQYTSFDFSDGVDTLASLTQAGYIVTLANFQVCSDSTGLVTAVCAGIGMQNPGPPVGNFTAYTIEVIFGDSICESTPTNLVSFENFVNGSAVSNTEDISDKAGKVKIRGQ